MGVMNAVICFNEGAYARTEVLKALKINPDVNTCEGLRKIDYVRICEAEMAVQKASKEDRTTKRQIKRKQDPLEQLMNTTRREDQRITQQAFVDPTVTRSTTRADVGVTIVPQTISRHFAEANLKSKRLFRALSLKLEHRQLRLQWCQARSMRNVTNWPKVVLSHASRFVLGTDDNRVRVWRRSDERYNSPSLFYVTLPAQLV
ncbi:HTH_Tnp_Tc3_2 domain-containing protein [Trichonephila clavipes]|nr:HTH_Tnp_Tc3_2 domain-containing protein [Trichonephila clavipes]